MKIWLKNLLGCILGVALALVLQSNNETAATVIRFLSDFALRAGKFALVPLLFFTMTASICGLRESKGLLKVALYTVFITLVSTALLTALGLASVLIFWKQRIPISVEEVTQVYSLDILQNILKLVPESNFESFIDGAYLLPVYIFAGFAGAGCASDKAAAKPTLTLFNSIAHVCYQIVCFFIDMFAIGLIAISCAWMFNMPKDIETSSLRYLILLVSADMAVIVLILYPLILRFALHERHPFRVLYACIASLLTAFFTADHNVTLAMNYRHARESLGVDSKIGSVALPVFSTFARGGAALVLAITFTVILKSYSDMPILSHLPWIFGVSFALSFFLGGMPTGGPVAALAVMCAMYGSGYETGYLIIKPIAFFLCSAAATIDAATSLFATYYIASREKLLQHREVRFYI